MYGLKLISCYPLPWPGELVAVCLAYLVLADLPGLLAILAVVLLQDEGLGELSRVIYIL